MTDTPPLPEPDFGSLSAEQYHAGIEALQRAGMSPETIAARLAGKTPSPTPPAPQGPRLATREAEGLVAALRKAGMAEDRIKEALAADGYTLPVDDRTREQREHDRDFGMEDQAYQFRFPQGGVAPELARALHDACAEFASGLSLPAPLAAGMVEHLMLQSQKLNAMPEAERTLALEHERQAILRTFKSEPQFDEAAELVDVMLAHLPENNPILTALKSGQVVDEWIFRTLFTHARHVADWAVTRPGQTPNAAAELVPRPIAARDLHSRLPALRAPGPARFELGRRPR